MLGVAPQAFMLAGKIVFCALVSFVGAFLILSAWFDRKISGTEAGLLLVGLLSIQFVGIWLSIQGGLGLLVITAVVLGMPIVFYVLGKHADRRMVKSFDEEDIAGYQQAMQIDPKNVAAHSLLAEVYRRQGKLEAAIEEYRAALQLAPTLQAERYWVQRLEAQIEAQARAEMTCPRCNTPRPAQADTCPECGRLYSTVEKSAHAFRTMPVSRKAAWATLVAAVFAGLVALSAVAPGILLLLCVVVVFAAPLTVIIINARTGDRSELRR